MSLLTPNALSTMCGMGCLPKRYYLSPLYIVLLCRLKHLLTWNLLISTQIIQILLVMPSKSILFLLLSEMVLSFVAVMLWTVACTLHVYYSVGQGVFLQLYGIDIASTLPHPVSFSLLRSLAGSKAHVHVMTA